MTELNLIMEFLSRSGKPRVEALTEVLDIVGLEYVIEEYDHVLNNKPLKGHKNKCGVKNVVIPLTNGGKYVLLVAHYDIFPRSTGINDNTCAVAMLINAALELREKSAVPVKILFTDKEESGMVGSSRYCMEHADEIIKVLVFDIIGYGDTAIYGEGMHANHSFNSIKKDIQEFVRIDSFLPSDNLIFDSHGIPTILVTAAHKDDLVESSTGFHRFKGQPKFYESFHNGKYDNDLKVINFELIEKIRGSLVKCLR